MSKVKDGGDQQKNTLHHTENKVRQECFAKGWVFDQAQYIYT